MTIVHPNDSECLFHRHVAQANEFYCRMKTQFMLDQDRDECRSQVARLDEALNPGRELLNVETPVGGFKMTKRTKADELEKRRLDRQLDEELDDTFPASDAPKVNRTPHGRFVGSQIAQMTATDDIA